MSQVQIPAHSHIPEGLGQAAELIVTQDQIPSGDDHPKLLRQRLQVAGIQIPMLQRPIAVEAQALPQLPEREVKLLPATIAACACN